MKLGHLQRRETWMDLETVIQSEVSQKEKNKYCIFTHICGIQKNRTDEPVCQAEIETQMWRTNVWTPRGESGGGGGGGEMNWETGIHIYTLTCIKQITNKNLLYKKIFLIKFKKKRKKKKMGQGGNGYPSKEFAYHACILTTHAT